MGTYKKRVVIRLGPNTSRQIIIRGSAKWAFWISPTSVLAQDLEGKLVYANRKALSFFGYQLEEFIGMPSLRLVPDKPGVKEKREDIIKEILADGKVEHFYNTERVRKDGLHIIVPHWAGYSYRLGENYSFGAILFHNSTRK